MYKITATDHSQSILCIFGIDISESFFYIPCVLITLFLFIVAHKVQCFCCLVFHIVIVVIFLFVIHLANKM